MTLDEVMRELESMATPQTRRTYVRHGVPAGRVLGVKIGDLKKILRTIRGDQRLALELYATGILDAMYLAGLSADGAALSRRQIDTWARQAEFAQIAQYSIPGVACESAHAAALADTWIDAKAEHVASAGWATWAGIVATRPDGELDLARIRELLARVAAGIHQAPNRVRHAMNGFLISVGAHVRPLLAETKRAARAVGTVEVDMGNTACTVPRATDAIAKIEKMGRVGRKRPTMNC